MNKAKIALVADVPNWAFFNIADQIRLHLTDNYEFSIYYSYEHYDNRAEFVKKVFSINFDIVHFFDRFFLNNLILSIASAPDFVRENFIQARITCSVYDHLLIGPADLQTYKNVFNYIVDGYTVSSEKLFNFYSELPEYPAPDMVIEDSVDPNLFYHENLDRFADRVSPLVIGWAGNSKWMEDLDGVDHKGLHTIIKPALEELKREGINVIGRFADSSEQRNPLEEMVHYYNSIDIYVCASDIEGTPNPVLEAMACGIPVITTDVGIVTQAFGPLQQEYILKARNVETLKERIRQLVNSPERRKALSEENLFQMKSWTREAESRKWDTFFQMILSNIKPELSQPAAVEKNAFLMTKKDAKRLCIDLLHNCHYFELEEAYNALIESYSWKVTEPLRRMFKFVRKFKKR